MNLLDLALEAFDENYTQPNDSPLLKTARKAALKKAFLVLTSTQFPNYIHEQVEQEIPWTRLLDSNDHVEGPPLEAIVKAYLRAIVNER